jgi:alkanesulfonate monooxygenase SsuD/methylene tetrahydromethanopterin reductase-like flavin-dependent oxidoreductase (luciferase family)
MARTFAGVREAAEGARRELPQGFAWGVYLHVAYGEDPDEARRRADEHLAWRYAEPRFLGDLAGKYAIGGDADGVAEAIMRYVEAGATHVIAFPILREGQRIEDGLDELAGAVLPAVRAAAGR